MATSSSLPLAASPAVLIDLRLGSYDPNRQDADATSAVKAQYVTNGARVRKTLFSGSPELRRLRGHMAAWRVAHYAITAPYVTDGARVLARTAIALYNEKFNTYLARLNDLKAEFRARYTSLIEADKKALGALYRESDYPKDPDTILSRFYASKRFMPINNPADLLHLQVDLGENVEELRHELEVSIRGSFRASQFNVWDRIGVALQGISSTLGDSRTNIKEATLANLKALVETAPLILVYHDEKLVELCAQITTRLATITQPMLKASGPGSVREAFLENLRDWYLVVDREKMVEKADQHGISIVAMSGDEVNNHD